MQIQILDAVIVFALCAASFVAGLNLANKYHAKAQQDTKDALERQFLRLKAGADADDPVKPYKFRKVQPQYDPMFTEAPPSKENILNTGDFDGDLPQPIPDSFLNELKKNGKAKLSFKKSDVA